MVIVISLFAMLMTGCSIKEDRSECPCRLVLDFSAVDTVNIKSLSVYAMSEGEIVFSDVIFASDFDHLYERDVPRCSLYVNVWSGDEGRANRKGVVIPFGCECPPIYMSSFVADATGEICRKRIVVHKNHCRLTVKVEGASHIPYSLTFYGNIDGYSLDGNPSSGDFSCVAYPDEKGGAQALLPRQLDSSLLMEVDDGLSGSKAFAIGQYITSSGYDWTTDSLEDITVILDYYVTYVQVLIQRWDNEYLYNITL